MTGQRVVLPEERNDRAALSCFPHNGSGDAGDIRGDAKALALEFLDVLGDRAKLGILQLWHTPDAVAQRFESPLFGIDDTPDFLGVLHLCLYDCSPGEQHV
jgi:hypothetical protein